MTDEELKNTLSKDEIKNAEWKVRDNRSDENYPDSSQCVYKCFEATIRGHRYTVEYSEEFGYDVFVDGKRAAVENTTDGGDWGSWELADFIGRMLGEILSKLDPWAEEFQRRCIAYDNGKLEERPSWGDEEDWDGTETIPW